MIARHPVINFDQAFLAHKLNFDPVLATGRDNRHAILLGVDTLPNFLIGVAVPDEAVLAHLELRSCPLGVRWHAEAKVQRVRDWLFDDLRLVHRVLNNDGALCRRLFLRCLIRGSLRLCFFLALFNFLFGFIALEMLDDHRVNKKGLFIDVNLSINQRLLLLRHISRRDCRAMAEKSGFSNLPLESDQSVALSLHLLMLLVGKHLTDISVWA